MYIYISQLIKSFVRNLFLQMNTQDSRDKARRLLIKNSLLNNLQYDTWKNIFTIIIFHRTTCESMCDTLPSLAVNTISVAQGGIATPDATKQLFPPDRVLKELYI